MIGFDTRFRPLIGIVFLSILSFSLPDLAQAGDGPDIELPPEEEQQETGETGGGEDIVTRGMRDLRLISPSPIGGYGELHLNVDLTEDDADSTLDFHRLVLFVAHTFSDSFRLYVELEVEHALTGENKAGEVGVEQAFVDWILLDAESAIGEFGIRGGIVLVPMGIVNQWHEPPIFHGVERPMVDKVIIPTTWREGGIGLFGRPIPELRFEVYLLGGMNAGAFRASDGLRKGRQAIAEAKADGLAVAGRIEYEPLQGLVFGVAGYAGQAGPNIRDAFDPSGDIADLDVWVTGYSVDARGRYKGLEARALLASFFITDTAELRRLVDEEGESLGLDVGSQLLGGYAEVAYDVLFPFDVEHQLLPFLRVEYYDTLESLKGRARAEADDDRQFVDVVAGLSYRPIPQVVLKGDFIYRMPGGEARNRKILDFGIGFMF